MKPAVDHDPHAFDGQRGLGDRGRQHDLPPPRRRRLDGAILGAGIKRAVERRDIDVGPADPRLQRLGDPADLALPRQENESRARLAIERLERRAGDLVLDPGSRIATHIARNHGKGAALAFDQRGVAEQALDPRAVERRRHDEETQVFAQRPLRVERQRQSEVGVERALVELVEQHARDAVECGIVEDLPCEHAFGDDLDAGLRRNQALEPHAQADRPANLFAQGRSHARGGGAGGEAARLEHDQAAALRPGLFHQRQRNARGLAGAGRGDQHRARMRCKRRP